MLSQIRSAFKDKQMQADSDLNAYIQRHVLNISASKDLIESAGADLLSIRQEMQLLHDYWQSEKTFYQKLTVFEPLLLVKERLSQALDALKILFNFH